MTAKKTTAKKDSTKPDENEAVESVASEDIERVDPNGPLITLESGLEVEVKPLKMREFFKLLRIVTRGGAELLPTMQLTLNQGEEEFVAQFLALLFFAIPEAGEESEDFLRAMVQPAHLKGNEKADEPKWLALEAELDNPEIADAITIIEKIVKSEAEDLKALGNRLRAAVNLAEKTGQLPT